MNGYGRFELSSKTSGVTHSIHGSCGKCTLVESTRLLPRFAVIPETNESNKTGPVNSSLIYYVLN